MYDKLKSESTLGKPLLKIMFKKGKKKIVFSTSKHYTQATSAMQLKKCQCILKNIVQKTNMPSIKFAFTNTIKTKLLKISFGIWPAMKCAKEIENNIRK